MKLSEFDEAYDDERRIQGAILTEPIAGLLKGPAIVVSADATLAVAIQILQERHVGCVLVVAPDGRLEGIFTERDVLKRLVGRPVDVHAVLVREHMTPRPDTLEKTAPIAWALNKMSQGGYRHVPIVDGKGRAIGVLSVKDIVDFIVDLFPAAVLNLPPEPAAVARQADGG